MDPSATVTSTGPSVLDEVPEKTAYTALSASYLLAFGGFLGLLRASGRALPEALPARDVALVGVATHKIATLLTRDRVTSPLRAPFTTNEGLASAGQKRPQPRG